MKSPKRVTKRSTPRRVARSSILRYKSSSTLSNLTRPHFQKNIEVKKLSDDAIVPTRGSSGAAGYDLYAAQGGVIPKRGKGMIKTDIAIKIAPHLYGRVAPRSGLAWKNSIDVGAGVIDSDYRGNIGVILFNHGDEEFTVKPGDRIAQLIFEKIETPEMTLVDELDDTNRGAGGFGSTGVALASVVAEESPGK